MFAVFAGPLKPDVKDNPDAYYDRPFDIFLYYYDTGIYRLSSDWTNEHGPSKQMDWGSWLYIVDGKGLGELIHPGKRIIPMIPAATKGESVQILPAIPARDIPKADWYGVLEVECS